MANIYALKGKPKSGKTPTLKILCDLIIKKYKKKGSHIINLIPSKPISSSFDIEYIIIFNNTMGIGLTSHGDDPARVKKTIEHFIDADCEIIFCACHQKGLTYDCVNSFAKHHKVDFTNQTIEPNIAKQTASNTNTANNLMTKAGL